MTAATVVPGSIAEPSATASTTPVHSIPRIRGNVTSPPDQPRSVMYSERLSPNASTRTSAQPGRGSGRGTSRTTSASGPSGRSATAARIVATPSPVCQALPRPARIPRCRAAGEPGVWTRRRVATLVLGYLAGLGGMILVKGVFLSADRYFLILLVPAVALGVGRGLRARLPAVHRARAALRGGARRRALAAPAPLLRADADARPLARLRPGADDQAAGLALARAPRVVRPRALAARPPALHRAPHAAAADLAGAARGLLPLRRDARRRVVRGRRDVPRLPGGAALAGVEARADPPRLPHRLHRGRGLARLDVEVVDRVAPARATRSPPCPRCTPPTPRSCCSSPMPGAADAGRSFAAPYTLGMWFTVVYLGDHYVADIIIGAAYAIAGWVLVPKLLRRRRSAACSGRSRRRSRPATSSAAMFYARGHERRRPRPHHHRRGVRRADGRCLRRRAPICIRSASRASRPAAS